MNRVTIGLLLFALDAGSSWAQLRLFVPGLVPDMRGSQYQVIEVGRHAERIQERRVVVVQNQADFEALWGETHVRSGPIPEIDWTFQQVVGIYAGRKASSGFEIHLMGVQDMGTSFTLHVGESVPAEGRMVSSLESSPFLWLLMVGKKPVQVVWH